MLNLINNQGFVSYVQGNNELNVSMPQTTFSGSVTITGNLSAAVHGHWGSFYDTTTQINTSVSGSNLVTMDTTAGAWGISIVSGSRITATTSGIYNVQFSLQVDKTDPGEDVIHIWLMKTGSNVEWSNTSMTIYHNDGKHVPAWNFFESLNAGEYLELAWWSPDASMRILAETGFTNPVRPNIPSVILTMQQV